MVPTAKRAPASLDDLFEGRWERDERALEDARSLMQQVSDQFAALVEWFAAREWWELGLMAGMGIAAVVVLTAAIKLRPSRYRLR